MVNSIDRLLTCLGTVHFLRGRGAAGGFWGESPKKKTALKGGACKKNKGKRGGHEKYFSNALRRDMFYYS